MQTAIEFLAAVRTQAEVVRTLTAAERIASDTYNRAYSLWVGVSDALAAVTSHPDAYTKIERLERAAYATLTTAREQLDRCAADTNAARATLRELEYPAAKDGATS